MLVNQRQNHDQATITSSQAICTLDKSVKDYCQERFLLALTYVVARRDVRRSLDARSLRTATAMLNKALTKIAPDSSDKSAGWASNLQSHVREHFTEAMCGQSKDVQFDESLEAMWIEIHQQLLNHLEAHPKVTLIHHLESAKALKKHWEQIEAKYKSRGSLMKACLQLIMLKPLHGSTCNAAITMWLKQNQLETSEPAKSVPAQSVQLQAIEPARDAQRKITRPVTQKNARDSHDGIFPASPARHVPRASPGVDPVQAITIRGTGRRRVKRSHPAAGSAQSQTQQRSTDFPAVSDIDDPGLKPFRDFLTYFLEQFGRPSPTSFKVSAEVHVPTFTFDLGKQPWSVCNIPVLRLLRHLFETVIIDAAPATEAYVAILRPEVFVSEAWGRSGSCSFAPNQPKSEPLSLPRDKPSAPKLLCEVESSATVEQFANRLYLAEHHGQPYPATPSCVKDARAISGLDPADVTCKGDTPVESFVVQLET